MREKERERDEGEEREKVRGNENTFYALKIYRINFSKEITME